MPQVIRTVEALEQQSVFGLIHTFESLLRTWTVEGRSVRPDHRMVAHSGFITVARRVEPGFWGGRSGTSVVTEQDETQQDELEAPHSEGA